MLHNPTSCSQNVVADLRPLGLGYVGLGMGDHSSEGACRCTTTTLGHDSVAYLLCVFVLPSLPPEGGRLLICLRSCDSRLRPYCY